jgi:hypothetical protein
MREQMNLKIGRKMQRFIAAYAVNRKLMAPFVEGAIHYAVEHGFLESGLPCVKSQEQLNEERRQL